MKDQKKAQAQASATRNSEVKCLAECPKCRDEKVQGLCGLDTKHASAHRCDRCSHTWS